MGEYLKNGSHNPERQQAQGSDVSVPPVEAVKGKSNAAKGQRQQAGNQQGFARLATGFRGHF